MRSTVLLTCVAAICFLFFYSGVLFLKKNDRKQSFLAELPMNLWFSLFLLVTACSVVNMIRIPVNLITVSLVSFLSGGVCWFFILKRGRQRFSFSFIDTAAFLAIAVVAAYFFIEQFGRSLYPLYETSDPSIHMGMALSLYNTGKLSGLLFSQFVNGMLIQAGSAFLPLTQYYKVFVLADGFMFLLSGLTFYSVVTRVRADRKYRILAAVLSLFYMIGYPLDNLVFGFVYLGMSVSILLVLLFLTNAYISGEYRHGFCVLLLMSGCYSLAICYSLFAPMIFFGVFFVVALCFIRQKSLFSWRYVLENLKIFLLPCAMALYYFYFAQSGPAMSALSSEGFIYRELYSNFTFLIAPVLFAVFRCIRQRNLQSGVVFFFPFLVYIVVTFLFAWKGSMSSYYFYKVHYPLWALCFYLACVAVGMLEKKDFSASVCYLLTVALLFLGGVTKTDRRINEKNVLLNPHVAAGQYFPIYYFNSQKILEDDEAARRSDWASRIELYDYAVNHCESANQPVPLADSWLWIFWYNAVTNQTLPFLNEPEEALAKIQNSRYAVIDKTSELYETYRDYFDSCEILFENDHGFIIKN